MSDHICPKCQKGKLRRSERRGFLEQAILPMFNLYPWRCSFCRTRVRLSDRGPRRQYVQPQSEHHVQPQRTARESGEHGI